MNEQWLQAWLKKRLADMRADIASGGNAIYDCLGMDDTRGTCSSVAAEALMDSKRAWIVNLYQNTTLHIRSGTALGNRYPIKSNTAQALAVSACDLVTDGVVASDRYQIILPSMEKAAEWLSKTDIKVILGYARSPDIFPCLTVVRTVCNEKQKVIGGIMGRGSVAGTGESTVYGSWWDATWTIGVWTDNPDTSYWLHRLIEYYYIQDVGAIARQFVEGVRASGGDIVPQGEMYPEMVYLREFNISGTIKRTAETTTAAELVDEVAGTGTWSYWTP